MKIYDVINLIMFIWYHNTIIVSYMFGWSWDCLALRNARWRLIL